jgi:hypothetical protein
MTQVKQMAERKRARVWLEKLAQSRVLRWGGGLLGTLVLLSFVAAFFLDEPLRATMEKRMNSHLKGYSVRLPGLHLNPIGLSLTLKGLTVLQKAHPDPPIVYFPVLKASVLWREVLSGKLVAEFKLKAPRININLEQLHSEADSAVTIEEHGWQKAVEDIYPLKINSVKVSDASVTYLKQAADPPLALTHLNLQATNIRNIHLPDKVYPSTFHLDTAILGSGRGSIDGKANFLGEPYPGIKGRLLLEKVPLDKLKPVLSNANLSFHGGELGAAGEAEYAPNLKIAHLEQLTIQGMNLQYTHSKATAALEKTRVVKVEKVARKLNSKPGLVVRADQVRLTGCTLGYRNDAPGKRYRIFFSDADLQLNNFSKNFSQGPAQAKLKAKFMGSGPTAATMNFRPAPGGRDFDLQLRVEETQMTALNDLLRDYGNFDVSAGVFSLTTELHVKNDHITGYVKPFFRDMKVYDARKDKGKSFTHKAYEVLVGAAAKVLQNRPRQEVATKVDIKGSPSDPKASGWQIVTQLVRNAFFTALVPSFEKKAGKK